MNRRRRGQLVLLAAAVVVTALVPMLLAYAQLTVGTDAGAGVAGDATGAGTERATLDDTTRSLERAVAETTVVLANGTEPDAHRPVAAGAAGRLGATVETLESSGTSRGVAVDIQRNVTAAREWARTACPRGAARAFGTCVATDGVVTQTRANATAVVAIAFDVSVRGPDGSATATVVVRGVRGAVAAPAATAGTAGNASAPADVPEADAATVGLNTVGDVAGT